jgi:hypothetical protein
VCVPPFDFLRRWSDFGFPAPFSASFARFFGDDARVLLVVMMIRSHVLLLICEAVVCRLMIVSQNISFCQAWQLRDRHTPWGVGFRSGATAPDDDDDGQIPRGCS